MKSIKSFIGRLIRSEDGNVESALVIIPLLILFLAGMQLSLFSHSRNMEKVRAQDSASTRAISGEFSEGDEFIHIESSGDGQNLDLLITRGESRVQNLLPGILGNSGRKSAVEVQSFAVIENQR